MEKSPVDRLLDQLAAGLDPALRRSDEALLSSEPGGADLLNAYQQEPEQNRGLLGDVLGQTPKGSNNPVRNGPDRPGGGSITPFRKMRRSDPAEFQAAGFRLALQ